MLGSQMGIEPVEHSERENLQLGAGCTVEPLIERHQTIAIESCMRRDKEVGKNPAWQFPLCSACLAPRSSEMPGPPHARSARPLPNREESQWRGRTHRASSPCIPAKPATAHKQPRRQQAHLVVALSPVLSVQRHSAPDRRPRVQPEHWYQWQWSFPPQIPQLPYNRPLARADSRIAGSTVASKMGFRR